MEPRCWVGAIEMYLVVCAACLMLQSCAGSPSVDVVASESSLRARDGGGTLFDQLPKLRLQMQQLGRSSASPSLDNTDYSHYLASENGEHVLFDETGPGVIDRFWHTGELNLDYQFFFDGESTARLHVDGATLWSGGQPPFVAPLMLDPTRSSGGSVSYFPIGFAKSLRITARAMGEQGLEYYNIGYSVHQDDSPIVSYTGQEDVRDAAFAWGRAGEPLAASADGDVTQEGTLDIEAGSSDAVVAIEGPGQITQLRFEVPALLQSPVTDDGRATQRDTQFRVSIDPANAGVRLARRLDYYVADQTARVLIDGAPVGEWKTAGSDPVYRWRDASFEIPASFTRDKSAITVKIEFVSSAQDWNEFHYWVYSKTAGQETLSDELDVGQGDSEQSHGYAISAPSFFGERSEFYRPDDAALDAEAALASVRLRIFWDGEATPAVDAGFSDFFLGTGLASTAVHSLPVGHDTGHFYCYFPMPFSTGARIVLDGPRDLKQIAYSVVHRALQEELGELGQFRTQEYSSDSTVVGREYDVLNVHGSGHYVGVSLTLPAATSVLEGNEHVYVDGARSPAIAGTGTEDYFNAGWYFQRGSFGTPTHGAQLRAANTSAYRFHLSDPVPFRSSIRLSFQPGAKNDVAVPYRSLAFYYGARARLERSDTLSPADAMSASEHGYTSEGARSVCYSSRFLSDDATQFTFQGYRLSASSTFQLALPSDNRGALLRLLTAGGASVQRADVYVDDTLTGTFQTAPVDPALSLREQDLILPARITMGKTSLRIRIQPRSDGWNDLGYELFALTP